MEEGCPYEKVKICATDQNTGVHNGCIHWPNDILMHIYLTGSLSRENPRKAIVPILRLNNPNVTAV